MFYRKLSIVLFFTVLSQAIPLLILPIITRSTSQENLGTYFFWYSVLSVVVVLAIARYDMAIYREKMERNIFAIFKGILIISIFVSCLIAFLLPVLAEYFSELSFIAVYSTQLGISVFCMALIQTCQAILIYRSNFKLAGYSKLSLAGFTSLGLLCASFYSDKPESLITSHTLTVILSLIITFKLCRINIKKLIAIDNYIVLKVLKINYRFPLFSLPADFINMLAMYLPGLLLLKTHGAAFVAIYTLTIRVLSAPVSLIAGSVLTVYKDEASDEYRKHGHCRTSYIKTFKRLFLVAIVPFFILYFVIEPAFEFLFGVEYKKAGEIALLMLPLYFAKFVVSPLSYTLYLFNWQRYDLIWQVSLLGVTFFSFTFFTTLTDSIKCYVLCYCLLYVVYFFMSFSCSKGRRKL